MFDFRKEMSIWEILYYLIIGLIGFIFESILRFIDDFFLKFSLKLDDSDFRHNLSLIAVCLIIADTVFFIVSASVFFMGKHNFAWFTNPLEYGIFSTALYIFILLCLTFSYLVHYEPKIH